MRGRGEEEEVIRPDIDARVDATDDGLEDIPCPCMTVGMDNFKYATKTRHFVGDVKCCFLTNVVQPRKR